MLVVRFDSGFDIGQRQHTPRILCQRLGLNAAKHSRAATFILESVRALTHYVLITALAMRQNTAQVALRAAGHKQRRLFACQVGNVVLQSVHTGVVAKHIVTKRGRHHGLAHTRCGLRYRVAAQVNGWQR